MKISEMTGNQKTAFRQVIHATDWVTGGYENSVADGHMEEMPSTESMAQEIYYTVTTTTTWEDMQGGKPQKEVKFCGKEWIMERIYRRLAKYGYTL